MPAPIPLHNVNAAKRVSSNDVPQFVPYQRNAPIAFSLKPASLSHNVSSSEDDDDEDIDVSNIFVPWESPDATIDHRVRELEAQLAQDEKLLERKLWKDTHTVNNSRASVKRTPMARPKTLPNGMPSIFAFMDE